MSSSRNESPCLQPHIARKHQEAAMTVTNAAYAAFAPSHRPATAATRVADIDPAEPIEISVYLKPLHPPQDQPHTRASMAARRADDHADDIARLSEFAAAHGLTVTAVEPGRRLVRLAGTAAQMQEAFQTELAVYEHHGKRFRARSGALQLPQNLHESVEAVLGLDTRPQAQPHFQTGGSTLQLFHHSHRRRRMHRPDRTRRRLSG
jgi:hypothetical protein